MLQMAKEVISTQNAPGAVGPYSQAIKAGDFLFASGQIPINPEKGRIVASTVADQTEQSMKNVGAILEAAGLSFDDVVKTTVYIVNMEYFGAVNEVYGKYFQKTLPARSCVEISKLPKDALVEVEVVAYCGK
jgi:2-iminobutanoate/2-iminopropanoate deaminase